MTLTPRELRLLSDTDVLGYVQASNAARNAQAVAEGWQMWTTIPESAEYLAEFSNCYELELRGARGTYYDMHRDAYCYKPSWASYGDLTIAELEAEMAVMDENMRRAVDLEAKWEAEDDRRCRDDIMLGIAEPTEDTVLETWEVFEAIAESEGHGA